MSETSSKLCAAATDYLRRRGIEVQTVTSLDEYTEAGGYCSTCFYLDYYVAISYITPGGHSAVYDYWGEFSELIVELTKD